MNKLTAVMRLAREALRLPHPIDPVRAPRRRWMPSLWASKVPLRHRENFAEIFRALNENRDNLDYAWRILNHGVCDGCSLGTTGLRDWTMENIHLCNVRLRLLRLNTMPPLDAAQLADAGALQRWRARDLRALGRLPHPMIRRRGEPGFRRISWEAALSLIAERIRASHPERLYFYMTSRGEPNENYYAFQKAARAIGTNNVDNAARICHSPSTFGLKATLGVGATTCSYRDLIGTDLVVFVGSNVANNQPMIMKYLYYARKAGTQVAVINPYREPALEHNWVPSDLESALFGTRMADRFFQISAGGDIAFLNGALKAMIEQDWVDHRFIAEHTRGFDELRALVETMSWDALARVSGVPREQMQAFAEMLSRAARAVFVWGMGITQHARGEENVYALVNLALAKGYVGREGCGLMPIRGHSGVQGGAEMGAYATAFPGGRAVDAQSARQMAELWGFAVPEQPGLTTAEMIGSALAGEIDVLCSVGGSFNEVLPDPKQVKAALANIPLRVHFDIVLASQMLIEPKEVTLLLPAATRYEMPGGVTETTTERRIIFSPEIPGPRIGEARPEWEVYLELARRVRPELADRLQCSGTPALREEISRVVPLYRGIEALTRQGDQVQYGGRHLCAGWKFPTPDGKAHFITVPLGYEAPLDGRFHVVNRRGKQFNSILHEESDPINAKPRDAILVSQPDLERLRLCEGDEVVLENEHGALCGRLFAAPVSEGTLEVYWPEANVLVNPQNRSALARIPAYRDVTATLRRCEREHDSALKSSAMRL
ncbi:FdhF/YdeP family oxidoreductase [Nitrococcus mobilis]|uniref:Probable formate dehydrogenase n=1 Tax=Nitrococcus mobilis Nb-231 TaxID=314278 RepID=A4BUS0_9GAMM|nr:FdhF/YdeP family oxidoreductase [Nitrococcus mobilis]EAR20524.1 probable formate dehydrogenase [Nitrococcus mobilis Nb-231]